MRKYCPNNLHRNPTIAPKFQPPLHPRGSAALNNTTTIRVAAPATTANLGPGYDCLGMALDLWNTIEIQPLPPSTPPSISVSGEGADELESGPNNLVYQSMEFLYRELNRPLPPLRLHCRNEIPLARGLGSSAAAIAAGLTAANALAANDPTASDDNGAPHPLTPAANAPNANDASRRQRPFTPRDLLEMAATIEGHPDNVAPAILGGLQLVITDDTPTPHTTPADAAQASALYTVPINLPAGIHAVLFIPQTRIATEAARAVLPRQIPIAHAVHNIARAALLVAGMSTNHLEYLSIATQDQLHQPHRQPLFPPMKLLIKAAMDAGALGAFLSGSGSTILALTQGREMTVAYEMAEAARQSATQGTLKITQPTPLGAHLLS